MPNNTNGNKVTKMDTPTRVIKLGAPPAEKPKPKAVKPVMKHYKVHMLTDETEDACEGEKRTKTTFKVVQAVDIKEALKKAGKGAYRANECPKGYKGPPKKETK